MGITTKTTIMAIFFYCYILTKEGMQLPMPPKRSKCKKKREKAPISFCCLETNIT